MRNTGPTTHMHITLPDELLAKVDAAKFNKTRSKFVADLIAAHFRRSPNSRQNAGPATAAKSLPSLAEVNGE